VADASSSFFVPATMDEGPTFSLNDILSENHENIEHPGINGVSVGGWDEEEASAKPVEEGTCIECEGKYLVREITWFAEDT
jgi:hypothetical protein